MEGINNIELLSKYKDFFKDLNAKKIMNDSVFVLKEDNIIKDAQKIMKFKQISGVPIVDNDNKIINIISIEDIIHTLEDGVIDKKIGDLERKKVICINVNDEFEKILDCITTFPYGRFPVINDNDELIGIITKHDIFFAIMSKLSLMYLHDERRKEILESKLSVFIKSEKESDDNKFEFDLNNTNVNNAGQGSALLKGFLQKKAYAKKIIRNISISTYEAEVNVVIHGGGIGKIKAICRDDSVVIYVEDIGPGIENIEQAMTPGFSTASEDIRAVGFGAGMGLANIKRFADKLIITSEKNKGVKVEMLFWLT